MATSRHVKDERCEMQASLRPWGQALAAQGSLQRRYTSSNNPLDPVIEVLTMHSSPRTGTKPVRIPRRLPSLPPGVTGRFPLTTSRLRRRHMRAMALIDRHDGLPAGRSSARRLHLGLVLRMFERYSESTLGFEIQNTWRAIPMHNTCPSAAKLYRDSGSHENSFSRKM